MPTFSASEAGKLPGVRAPEFAPPGQVRPDAVKAQIAGLLAAHPELREDDEALALSLESETDAVAVLEQLVKRIGDAKAYASGLKSYIEELDKRHKRLLLRAEHLRTAIFKIMEAAELKKVPTPMGTLLIVNGQQSVEISDRNAIPEEYRRHPEWELNKTAAKEAIKSGKHVPGVYLSNATPVLQLRTK